MVLENISTITTKKEMYEYLTTVLDNGEYATNTISDIASSNLINAESSNVLFKLNDNDINMILSKNKACSKTILKKLSKLGSLESTNPITEIVAQQATSTLNQLENIADIKKALKFMKSILTILPNGISINDFEKNKEPNRIFVQKIVFMKNSIIVDDGKIIIKLIDGKKLSSYQKIFKDGRDAYILSDIDILKFKQSLIQNLTKINNIEIIDNVITLKYVVDNVLLEHNMCFDKVGNYDMIGLYYDSCILGDEYLSTDSRLTNIVNNNTSTILSDNFIFNKSHVLIPVNMIGVKNDCKVVIKIDATNNAYINNFFISNYIINSEINIIVTKCGKSINLKK